MRGVFCGAKAVSLRPSLGAAASLESRYGFQKLFDAVGEGNLTVISDVIETSSDCKDFIQAIDGIPLIQVFPVVEQVTKHILALAGVDQDQTEKAEPQNGETMPYAEYHKRLFAIGTGWLGWSPAVTWDATPKEIIEAYSGHVEHLKAIYGGKGEDQERRQTDRPENAKFDRVGLANLKLMARGL